MLITGTSDKIEAVLGANVTTNQLHINASYNVISSSAVTPTKTSVSTNNITAVSIVPSPSSGNQHQLRYCVIFNSDTVPTTVTIQTNYNGTTRKIMSVILQVNEYIQYTHRTGWKVFTMNGGIKNITNNYALSETKPLEYVFSTLLTATVTVTSNTYCYYIGKATGAYSYVVLNYILITATTTSTWNEMAIYKGTPSIGTGTSLTRVGFVDCTGNWAQSATVNRSTSIPCNNLVQEGDDLWLVIGSSGGTGPSFRGHNIADDIGSGMIQTSSNNRPSTNATLTGTVSTTVNGIWYFWNGV